MKKSTWIAVVVFLGLLVGAWVSLQKKPEAGIRRITLATVETGKIDRVVISGKNAVEMKREGERWMLGDGKEAESSAIKALLEALPKITSSDMVSKDSAKFGDLEVDGEKGTRVVAYAGPRIEADFVVGKVGGGGTNMKIGEEVFLVKNVYPYIFSKPVSSWHKLKLFDTGLDDVAKLEVALNDGRAFSLVRKDDQWAFEDPQVVPAGFRFDATSASSLVSELANVRAQEIVSDLKADQTKLFDKADKLAFTNKTGQRFELQLGAPNEKEGVYAQVAGKSDLYLISKYNAKSLRKGATDLRDLKLLAFEIAKVKSLIILDGKKTLTLEKQGAQWKAGKTSETIPPDFELDDQMVERRLQSLANTRATKVASETADAKTGLKKPEAVVEVKLEDGSSVKLVFGNTTKDEDSEVVYARGNVDSEIYLMAKGSRMFLTGLLPSFKKQPPAPDFSKMDPQTLAKLPPEVRQSLMKQMQEEARKQEMIKAIQKQMESK